ncbi:hypothetical protein PTTG_02996 [Puccinia triticina 1-1 BBBD Race 1]|uniref:Uncharacterized protein n=1 Tax=Puccinia triticina (isolate 1-1 / race 1 (BBBD)) TaxID=630390 RepID=A0A0C4EQD8_PUCT1|nr:hypothetical protein PTTG_02996 [Puccinia triticina 1-1 BBBD Race 1]
MSACGGAGAGQLGVAGKLVTGLDEGNLEGHEAVPGEAFLKQGGIHKMPVKFAERGEGLGHQWDLDDPFRVGERLGGVEQMQVQVGDEVEGQESQPGAFGGCLGREGGPFAEIGTACGGHVGHLDRFEMLA